LGGLDWNGEANEGIRLKEREREPLETVGRGMNLPNSLTLLRIFLVPVFLIAVLYRWFAVALILFAIAGVTDLLDGFLARRLALESRLGLYLDPLADKLLISVSFISLAALGLLPAWLAVVVVAKDLFISLGAGILYFAGLPLDVAPSSWGKWSALFQFVTIGLALMLAIAGEPQQKLLPLYIATGLLTPVSGFGYILAGMRSLPEIRDDD